MKYIARALIVTMAVVFGAAVDRIIYVHTLVKSCEANEWFTVAEGTSIECSVMEKDGHPFLPEEDDK